MHVLITGETGLIGQRLCQALIARGDAVTVLSRKPHQVASICIPSKGNRTYRSDSRIRF